MINGRGEGISAERGRRREKGYGSFELVSSQALELPRDPLIFRINRYQHIINRRIFAKDTCYSELLRLFVREAVPGGNVVGLDANLCAHFVKNIPYSFKIVLMCNIRLYYRIN